MAVRIAAVEFSSAKNCFVSLPLPWAQEFQKKQCFIFELEWGDCGRAYVSWAGDTVRLSTGTPTLQMNGLYGNKLGLRHGEEVLIKPVPTVHSCSKVCVEPATADDWEILELNTGYVESDLLNQVRIVWPGQILPVWIEKKICIFVKIGSTDPLASCVQLERNTELHVAPKLRRPPQRSTAPNPNPARRSANGPYGRGDAAIANSPSMGSLISSALSGYTSDYDTASSPSDSTFSTTRLTDGSSSAASTPPSEPWAVPSEVLDEAIPWSYRVWRRIRSMFIGDGSNGSRSAGVADSEEARRKMAAEFWRDVRIVARVQLMLDKGGESATPVLPSSDLVKSEDKPQRQHTVPSSPESQDAGSQTEERNDSAVNSYTHLMQPTTVYLSSSCELEFVRHHDSNATGSDAHRCPVSEFVTFLAYLTKVPSPRERRDEVNRKFQQTQKRYEEKRKGSGPARADPVESAKDDTTPYCVVRVIIHSNELRGRRDNGETDGVYGSDAFQNRDIDWFVQIPDLLRRQMGLEATAKAELRPVLIPPVPIRSMALYPLFDKRADQTAEDLLLAFDYWVSCVSCMISPIPIKQHGTLLRFPITRTGDVQGEFLLSVNYQEKLSRPASNYSTATSPDDAKYYLLHPLIVRRCRPVVMETVTSSNKPPFIANLPARNVTVLDAMVGGYRLRELGAVANLGKTVVDYLNTALMTRPLAASLGQHLPGRLQGGLLVCGARGSGKSALARAVCRELTLWPALAHVGLVECKALKGKRVDTIRKVWEEALNEAAWRQPAVVVLDDLDHLAASPLGPEQEIGPEAVYHTRIAEVLKDIMMAEIREGSRVCIVATARSKGTLHQSLTSSRGCHLFQGCIEIPALDKAQRGEIFTSAVQSKVEIDLRTLEGLDCASLTSRMEGYAARDIVTVVERAIHAGCGREMVEGRVQPLPEQDTKDSSVDEIFLTHNDFELALRDYMPATLRDVPLHSAGELGWDDVGGLKEAKESLLETLQLPAKYPSLFALSPLRLRSGLLLYGPPGTGKTLLGGVVAKECGLNFISIKGPELLSKYIGASEQAVRDLFDRAQSAKPCILFFDEFDSLAPRRGHDSTGVTDRVVNQLLTQLDGVEGLQGVYVLGATSRPDLIDPALLRPGRLDKCLFCPIPSAEERLEIMSALSRNLPLSDDVDIGSVAVRCDHFTGADFKALLYNAQLLAVHTSLSHHRPTTADLDYYEPVAGLNAKHCSMGADDWKLTFMESFSAEGNESSLADETQMSPGPWDNGSGAARSPRRNPDSAAKKSSRSSVGSASTSSSGASMDFVRVTAQDANGEYCEVARSSEVGGHAPSMKELAATKRGAVSTPRLSEIIDDSIENEEVPGPLEGLGDPYYTGLKQTDAPIIYMPTLRDGAVEPNLETQEKVQAQIAIIKENYRQRHCGKQQSVLDDRPAPADGSTSTRISQVHLLRAYSEMKPSVTASERARYQTIYDNFVQSRGGNFNSTLQQAGQKRATLA